MKDAHIVMEMPMKLEIVGETAPQVLEAALAYFSEVDERFSTYKSTSEISRINRGEIEPGDESALMKEVFEIAEKTRQETGGYFDIRRPDGKLDPSGVVKGWAIKNAEELIQKAGHENYFLNVGGDIASHGKNPNGEDWSVGIRNPFNSSEIVKVIYPRGRGVATSGSYERGAHIYNPHDPKGKLDEVVSITVIGPDVLQADLFATAAFAMGKRGIEFIENAQNFEGYAIDSKGIATMTSGLGAYTQK